MNRIGYIRFPEHTVKKLLQHFIQWYSLHFSFPQKGLKYFEQLLKRTCLYEQPFLKKLPSGLVMELSLNDHIQKYLFWYGAYEKKEVTTMLSFVSNQSVLIDIGANIGYYSLLFAQKANQGAVWSFEPVSNTFMQLQKHIALNHCKHIHAIQGAISDYNGETTVYISGNDNVGMSGLQKAENYSGQSESIPCYTLDAAIKDFGISPPDFIKIDVEGAEINVLNGMSQILSKYQPLIFIEISAATLAMYHHTIDQIYTLLHTYQYKPYKVIAVNQLQEIRVPEEVDLAFFIPQNFVFPSAIRIQKVSPLI